MKKAVAGIGVADGYGMEVLIWQHKLYVSYIANCALFEDVSAIAIASASASASASDSASASALGCPRPPSLLCFL